MRSRLAFLIAVLPLCVYGYACSSDDAGPPATDDDAGSGEDGGNGDNDSGGDKDSGHDSSTKDAGDGGGDAGACTSNPLADAPDGGTVIGAAALKEIPAGQFPDGPVYVDTFGGALVFSQAFGAGVVRIQSDGGGTITPVRAPMADSIAIGNAVSGDFIYTAQAPLENGTPAILRTIIDGGATDAASFAVGAAGSPNDIVVSAKGFAYFTDPPYQGGTSGVYRLDVKDGGIGTVALPVGSNHPDGIALSPQGDALYVSISGFTNYPPAQATDRKVLRFPVDANGVVGAGAPIPGFTPKGHPTGIAVDAGGNIWIAENALAGADNGQVEVISPTGKKWGEITVATSRPTGVAFGGADNKTVYITAERGVGADGSLYMFTSRCAGIR